VSAESADTLQALAQRHGRNYRWLLLVAATLGALASLMSLTIVNVAVPDMMRYFGVGQERAQWVSSAFMAAMGVSMLATPWLLCRFGYRHTSMAAAAVLVGSELIGGMATRFELLIAMRAAEGLAAGVLQPVPAIIVLRAFATGTQGRALGLFGFGIVLAPTLGPTVGGLLVERFGWRSIFIFVALIGVCALGLARTYLPVSAPGGEAPRRKGRLDWAGIALATIAVALVLHGLTALHVHPGPALSMLAGGSATVALFLWQQRRSTAPLISPRAFKSRPLAIGGFVSFVYGAGLFGSTYLVPVFLQTALHYPPSLAGAALLPASILLALTIPIGGQLADRMPPYRLVSIGLILLAVSMALMAVAGDRMALPVLMGWLMVGRLGIGLVVPSLSLGAMQGLEREFISEGATAISFLRQLGGAMGVGGVAAFLEWRLQAHAAMGHAALSAFADTFWLVGALTLLAAGAAFAMRIPCRAG
jgi:EmrB/QacA subfamily drug resistance transporter